MPPVTVLGKIAQRKGVSTVQVALVRLLAQKHDLVERIESRSGLRQLEFMKILGMGDGRYELITV